MPNLSEAFEQHLASLSDDEWTALAERVRAPKPLPPLTGEDHQSAPTGAKTKLGLEEAQRRGYINDDRKAK